MAQYADQLALGDEQFQQAEARTSGDFEALPDGQYQAKITGCRLRPAEKDGHLMLEWEMEIVSGEHKGRKVWDYMHLTERDENGKFQPREKTMPYLKGRFEMLQEPLEKLSDLASDMKRAVAIGKIVDIRLKTNDDFQNCYFNKLAGEAPVGEQMEYTDDDVPF